MSTRIGTETIVASELLREPDAVVGQGGVDLDWHGLDRTLQDFSGCTLGWLVDAFGRTALLHKSDDGGFTSRTHAVGRAA